MKKNVAGQKCGAQLISASDGSAFTGSVIVYVTGDAGTQAVGSVGSGACTHEGNGYHTYAPAQAETNYDLIAFTFTGSGAIPVTVQIYSTFPQTGDNYARIGAPAGASVSADIAAAKVDTAAIKVKTDFLPSATAGAAGGVFIAGTNAATTVTTSFTTTFTGNLTGSVGSLGATAKTDVSTAVLTTQMTESYAADGTAPTLAQAAFLTMQSIGEVSISGTTLTVKKLDGSATAATYTLNDATTPTSRTRAS